MNAFFDRFRYLVSLANTKPFSWQRSIARFGQHNGIRLYSEFKINSRLQSHRGANWISNVLMSVRLLNCVSVSRLEIKVRNRKKVNTNDLRTCECLNWAFNVGYAQWYEEAHLRRNPRSFWTFIQHAWQLFEICSEVMSIIASGVSSPAERGIQSLETGTGGAHFLIQKHWKTGVAQEKQFIWGMWTPRYEQMKE
jgi:hypothetical protein